MKISKEDKQKIEEVLRELRRNSVVYRMHKFIQHGAISTLEHCENVVRASYLLDKKLHLHANKKDMLTGAFLHDFYLYDWHEKDDSHKWHGFFHAAKAAKNARAHFNVNPKVEQVIITHMWPLNLTKIPKSREAWIVCLADKYVSMVETIGMRKRK